MSDKLISIVGTLASILGLLIAIYSVLFTQYQIFSLVSLIVFESICILIWLYYTKKRNLLSYPHPFEIKCIISRYTYEDDKTMELESIKVVKITKPYADKIEKSLSWSGRGNVKFESLFLNKSPLIKVDGQTGEVTFDYPIPSSRFGDTIVEQFKLKMTDKTGENIPHLSYHAKYPTDLAVLEVILKYKDNNEPATFGFRTKFREGSSYTHEQKEKFVPFDLKTRSYRVEIPNPILGYTYAITWKK